MAGLTGALSAAEAGASVRVVEKGPQPGGSALLSSGLIWTYDSLKVIWENVPSGTPDLQGLVVQGLRPGVEWLRRLGVETSEWKSVHGGSGVSVDPHELVRVLTERLGTFGVRPVCECSLSALHRAPDGGLVVELAHADGREEAVVSNSVLFATGGFQGNPELINRYAVPSAEHVILRGNPWSTGDGFLAATSIGAAVSPGLQWFYGHALAAPPALYKPSEFRDASQPFGREGIALNLDGRRFANERAGTGEETLNWALAQQRDGRGVYVGDARILRSVVNGRPVLAMVDFAEGRGGVVLRAPTLDSLCVELASVGVDPVQALKSLEPQQGRAPTDARGPSEQRLLSDPPFFAVLVQAGITFTGGGLAVDSRTRVLRRVLSSSSLNRPVGNEVTELRLAICPGLYAAGCDVGNIHNGGYAGGLATAIATGRVAGREAAQFRVAS